MVCWCATCYIYSPHPCPVPYFLACTPIFMNLWVWYKFVFCWPCTCHTDLIMCTIVPCICGCRIMPPLYTPMVSPLPCWWLLIILLPSIWPYMCLDPPATASLPGWVNHIIYMGINAMYETILNHRNSLLKASLVTSVWGEEMVRSWNIYIRCIQQWISLHSMDCAY